MKRSTTLIIATFIFLALLFSAYLYIAPQPSVLHQANTLTPSTRRTNGEPTGSLGTGEGAWVKEFDERTGKLSSQFRGQEYERQPDGRMHVIKPEAEFFMTDGQVMHIEGETGIVTIEESLRPGKDQVFSGPSKAPTRGDMHDVHIQLYKDAKATTPNLTCVMDNATFDNEAFRIFTRDAVIDGKQVPADQIPVSLRGTDYDFDGKGLVIRLNQRDRRLEYLEVAHGDHLTIKNPSKLNEQLPTTAPAGSSMLLPPLPYMFATTDRLPPLPARPPTERTARKGAPPPVSRPTGPAVYRARFLDNVRVNQSDQDIATGDELTVDFLFEDQSSSATTRKSHAATATAPITKPVDTSQSTSTENEPEHPTSAGPQAAPVENATLPTTAAAATSPTTAPAKQPQPPVTIYWSGKLIMSPVNASGDEVPTAKNSIVRINGSPLHVKQGPSTITGATLVYRTATQHLSLRGTDAFPLTLKDGKGATVHGDTIDYLQQERIATIDGPGNALKILPAENPGDQPKQLATSWTRSAILFFTGQANEPLHIETAKLSGKVSVQHPQLQLKSDALTLNFDPGTTTKPVETATKPSNRPETPDFAASDLRHLDANGNVHAVVIGSNNRSQSIASDHLAMDTASTPDGRIYPKSLIADGSVVATDPDQELRAAHLKATLLPVAESASADGKKAKADAGSVPVELQHMTATDKVSVKTADGMTATADRLDVDVDPATQAQHVRLLGAPAHVTSKDNAVSGPYIEILPADQIYYVRGPGKMHMVQRETPQSKPKPVDVSWTDSVAVDGKRNVIDVLGGVKALSTDDAGAQNTATGNHLVINMMDAPQTATKPSTRSGSRKSSTQKATPLTGVATSGDPMQNKVVQTITFDHGATLESLSTNHQTNDVLRQMNLIGDVVKYDLPHKRVTVPVPGQLLFVNRSGSGDANNPTGSRGTTAFSWAQQMVFDQTANLMTMTGDVVVAHESNGGAEKPFRLDADKVVATLTPAAATQPGGTVETEKVQLKHVLAQGTVRFTSKDDLLTAETVDYDPETGILTARGQGRDPVHLFDPDGVQIGTATEVVYNTKTGENLKMTDAQFHARRKFPATTVPAQ
ncbi:MAG TPA: hypothetical protein VFE58_04595 [Tepidisphaeraceae bacterium]|jgi:lipopolysaccharide export system protein LptA|nr:hypothetical protein [Tepidisphaeraceae bacterium]